MEFHPRALRDFLSGRFAVTNFLLREIGHPDKHRPGDCIKASAMDPRHKPKRRSPPVTEEMAAAMRTMVLHLDMVQHDVAAHFRVNQGRVSEVISGKRHPTVPPAPVDSLGL